MTLFIELLDETTLRVCTPDNSTVLNDAELAAHLNQTGKADIVLLDSLHIQSKTFQRPVKDKKVLDQVIAADMADYLLHDSSHYQFAHQTIDGTTWVSWIEKSRLQHLKQRFAAQLPRVKALVSAPLLAARTLAAPHDDSLDTLVVFDHAPLIYALRGGQTTVLRSEHATAWLHSQQADCQTITLANDSSHPRIFATNAHKNLPNLWQAPRDTQATALPYGRWALMATAGVGLWLANSYANVQQAKQQNLAALNAQQQLLRQIFPNAGGGDPYGRMAAEHQRFASAADTAFATLDKLLQATPLTATRLTVDTAANTVIIGSQLPQNLQQQLESSGFTITQTTTEATITWQH